MSTPQPRAVFRAVLNGSQCLHPATVFDPVSARLAELLGFEIGMLPGSVAALCVLGAPDLALLTLTEFAEQAHRICRASTLPLMVDADHGFGNALGVMRTVEELESAGVSAVTIEDTLLPPAFGETGTQLISIAEGRKKMEAALAARRDRDFVIVGRTQAVGVSSLEDAVARARAYQQTGVDALFFVGVKTRAQLETLAGAVDLPIVLGNITAALSDREYLAAHGVRLALQGTQVFMAGVQGVYEALKALREGVPAAELQGIAGEELMGHVTRQSAYQAATESFLR